MKISLQAWKWLIVNEVCHEQCDYPEVIWQFRVLLKEFFIVALEDANIIKQNELGNAKEDHHCSVGVASEIVNEIYEDNKYHEMLIDH